jgi:hypothetical protein
MEEYKLRLHKYWVLIFLIALGCTAVQSVSEQAVQQKLAKITLGLTTKEEIETLFGKDHTTEKASWSYSFSDRAFVVSQSPRVGLSGLFPITAATESTNTRAFVTVRFNKHQTVSTLEVHRFFNTPFVNNYSYLLDRTTDRTLEAVRRAGETSNFRLSELDKSARSFLLLENATSDAQIIVKVEKQILHITSINPYERMSNEYRVFSRREGQFIERISASTQN